MSRDFDEMAALYCPRVFEGEGSLPLECKELSVDGVVF